MKRFNVKLFDKNCVTVDSNTIPVLDFIVTQDVIDCILPHQIADLTKHTTTNKIRCYIFKENELFVAVCLDLCLAAQHEIPNKACHKLITQISNYVEDIICCYYPDSHNINLHIQKRPSPFKFYIKYYYYLCKWWILNTFKENN